MSSATTDDQLAPKLEMLDGFVRSQLILEPYAYSMLTAHIAAAAGLAAFERFPVGWFHSPAPGCGKSEGMRVVEGVLGKKKAISAVNISEAVLYVLLSKDDINLLVDEAETVLDKGPRGEQIRGLLNSANRRNGPPVHRRNLAKGNDYVETYQIFAGIWLAGLGQIPATLVDRAIRYTMRRASSSEMKSLTRLREREFEQAVAPIRESIAAWMKAHAEQMKGDRPEIPEGFTPRQADCAEPLLVIADRAGGRWPSEVRRGLERTFLGEDAVMPITYGIKLLEGLYAVLEAAGFPEFMPTVEILRALVALDSGPFAQKYRGDFARPNDLNGASQRLASHLHEFGIAPQPKKVAGAVVRGYYRDEILEEVIRYCPGCEVAGVAASGGKARALTPAQQGDLFPSESLPEVATPATPQPASDWPEPPGGWRDISEIGFDNDKKEAI